MEARDSLLAGELYLRRKKSFDKFARLTQFIIEPVEIAVQAEPYNPADENAVAVMAESIDTKIAGNPGLEKAGYVRAASAKIIRAAKPEKCLSKLNLCGLIAGMLL